MPQVGLGIPQNWDVGRERGGFSISKARMMQPSGQHSHPVQKGRSSTLPCPAGQLPQGRSHSQAP